MECDAQLSNLPPFTDVRKIDSVHMQSFLFVVNRSKGLYKKSLHKIVNLSSCYYLSTELNCKQCNRAFQSWDNSYLPINTSVAITMFVIEFWISCLSHTCSSFLLYLLTYKLRCDRNVAALLRERIPGNSPTALRNVLLKLHTDEWLRKHSLGILMNASATG